MKKGGKVEWNGLRCMLNAVKLDAFLMISVREAADAGSRSRFHMRLVASCSLVQSSEVARRERKVDIGRGNGEEKKGGGAMKNGRQ
ncbi:hypothetical protein L1887_38610 [Cichorium endivia]|nr:hypothetical protein L1887_38610 [Cichorium endivia]